jgi:hypothetical protein
MLDLRNAALLLAVWPAQIAASVGEIAAANIVTNGTRELISTIIIATPPRLVAAGDCRESPAAVRFSSSRLRREEAEG